MRTAQVQPLFPKLLTTALELILSCECQGNTGCPKCVQVYIYIYFRYKANNDIEVVILKRNNGWIRLFQNIACGEYNEVLHKDAAIMIIEVVNFCCQIII